MPPVNMSYLMQQYLRIDPSRKEEQLTPGIQLPPYDLMPQLPSTLIDSKPPVRMEDVRPHLDDKLVERPAVPFAPGNNSPRSKG